MRLLVGHDSRHLACERLDGDWWCILDADEFYIDDPREFLEAVPKRFSSVWMQRATPTCSRIRIWLLIGAIRASSKTPCRSTASSVIT
jgi:hypothetical protein